MPHKYVATNIDQIFTFSAKIWLKRAERTTCWFDLSIIKVDFNFQYNFQNLNPNNLLHKFKLNIQDTQLVALLHAVASMAPTCPSVSHSVSWCVSDTFTFLHSFCFHWLLNLVGCMTDAMSVRGYYWLDHLHQHHDHDHHDERSGWCMRVVGVTWVAWWPTVAPTSDRSPPRHQHSQW